MRLPFPFLDDAILVLDVLRNEKFTWLTVERSNRRSAFQRSSCRPFSLLSFSCLLCRSLLLCQLQLFVDLSHGFAVLISRKLPVKNDISVGRFLPRLTKFLARCKSFKLARSGQNCQICLIDRLIPNYEVFECWHLFEYLYYHIHVFPLMGRQAH